MAIIATDHYEPPDDAIISDIYIDESSQTRHRHLVMGGLIIAKVDVAKAERERGHLKVCYTDSGKTNITRTWLYAAVADDLPLINIEPWVVQVAGGLSSISIADVEPRPRSPIA